jgi:hypothetical protein
MSPLPAFDPATLPGEVTLDHVIPAAAAELAPFPADLAEPLASALRQRGVDAL